MITQLNPDFIGISHSYSDIGSLVELETIILNSCDLGFGPADLDYHTGMIPLQWYKTLKIQPFELALLKSFCNSNALIL